MGGLVGGFEILKPYLIFFFLLKCQLSWFKKWTGDGRLFSWLLWMRFLSKTFIFLTILETSKRLPAHYHWNRLNLVLKFMVAFCLRVLLLRTIAIGKIVYAAGPLHVTHVLRLIAKSASFPQGTGDDLLLAAGNWKSRWDQSIDRNGSLPSPQVSHLFTGLTGTSLTWDLPSTIKGLLIQHTHTLQKWRQLISLIITHDYSRKRI